MADITEMGTLLPGQTSEGYVSRRTLAAPGNSWGSLTESRYSTVFVL